VAEVYSRTVLEHFRRPHNRGPLADPDIAHEGVNPLCGDRLRLQLRLDGDVIAEARFVGDACAITIAAASLFTEMIHGLSLEDAIGLDDERLVAALEADIRPGRRGCALLPLAVLRAGVEAWRGEKRV
jgi:nitrogen fixation protein NifU and related proteins